MMGKQGKQRNAGRRPAGVSFRCAVCGGPHPDKLMVCVVSDRKGLVHANCAPRWNCGCIEHEDEVVTLL